MGLLEIKKGELLIDDKPINYNSKSWQQNIGYVPQQIFYQIQVLNLILLLELIIMILICKL